jgi:hypothetical protein
VIRLRFVAHPGLFTWVVRYFQYGFWPSHVEAILPDGNLLGATFLDGGVVIRKPGYDAGKVLQDGVIELDATPEQEALFYAFLHDQVGKPYDWTAIISYLFPWRDWQEDDSWECSELQSAALSHCGLFPPKMIVGWNRITLRDIMLIASTLTKAT